MYKIGDIFYEDEHYSDRAQYCDENNLMIVEIEPDEEGNRRFQIQEIPTPAEEEQAAYEIASLKTKLSKTDYQAIKYGEHLLTDEQYAPIGRQREIWRKRINELQEKYRLE